MNQAKYVRIHTLSEFVIHRMCVCVPQRLTCVTLKDIHFKIHLMHLPHNNNDSALCVCVLFVPMERNKSIRKIRKVYDRVIDTLLCAMFNAWTWTWTWSTSIRQREASRVKENERGHRKISKPLCTRIFVLNFCKRNLMHTWIEYTHVSEIQHLQRTIHTTIQPNSHTHTQSCIHFQFFDMFISKPWHVPYAFFPPTNS